MNERYIPHRWEKLVDERVEHETTTTTIQVDGRETTKTTVKENRFAIFEMQHATCRMMYNGKPLDVHFPEFFSPDASAMAISDARQYCAYYRVDPSAPLVIEVGFWTSRVECVEVGVSPSGRNKLYNRIRRHEDSERVVVWSSRQLNEEPVNVP